MNILQLRRKLEPQLLRRPGVTGVSNVGDTLRIYVEGTEIFPSKIDKFPVEVFKTGPIKALSLLSQYHQPKPLSRAPWIVPKASVDPLRTGRYRPIPGGVSIGHEKITAGTMGTSLRFLGLPYGLSNNHVLAAGSTKQFPRANLGDPILQPGCYSADTKVMTENGLKHFYHLSKNDRIMTLNLETDRIEYQNPTKIHEYDYNGKMIHFQGQMYDLLVTPNHQLVVQREQPHRREREDRQIIIAEELVKGVKTVYTKAKELHRLLGNQYTEIGRRLGVNARTIRGWLYFNKVPTISHSTCQFIKTGIWNCRDEATFRVGDLEFDMEDWLDFFGWYISEGCPGGLYHEKRGNYRISIRQRDKENLKLIADSIRRLGFKPYVRWKHGSVSFYSKKIYYYLKSFGKSGSKYIPKELKALPPRKLKILLNTLVLGDGSEVESKDDEYKDNYLGEPRRYSSTSRRLAEDVAEIGIKCGYGMSITQEIRLEENSNDIYRVGFSCRNLTPRITKKPKEVQYSSKVYDITIPNQTLMVERGGKLVWSGNSYDGGTLADAVGTLRWYMPIDEGGPNLVDAAIFEPYSPDLMSDEILEIGVPRGLGTVQVGDIVQKSGRTSGHLSGEVIDVNATVNVSYGEFSAEFRNQIITDVMGSPGDSGSAVLDMVGPNLVGLLFAGSDYVTIHNHIGNVLNALGTTIPPTPVGIPVPLPFLAGFNIVFLSLLA